MKRNLQNPPSKIGGKNNPAYRKMIYNPAVRQLQYLRKGGHLKYGSPEHNKIRAESLAKARMAPSKEALRLAAIRASVRVTAACRQNQKLAAGRAVLLRPDLFSKAAGMKHIRATLWSLRDPSGRLHRFKNLNHFIRSNLRLFNDGDADWVQKGKYFECRARGGLKSLKPSDRKKVLGSWKGWTWGTLFERAMLCDADLLDRDKSKPREPDAAEVGTV